MLTKEKLDQHNADWGNLDYEDTKRLLMIQELLEGGFTDKALADLDEFIAERGYNENPITLEKED